MQPDAERFFPQSADTVENLRQSATCGHVGTQRRTYGLCTGIFRTAPQGRKEIYGLLGKTLCQSWKKKTRAVCRSEMRRGVGYRVGKRTLGDRAGAVEESRLHPKAYLFSGRVQAVGFRYSALCLAKELQLTGWVKNLTDGRVEAELQGQAELVDSFVERISQRGRIVVEFVEEEDRELCYEEGFEVR